MADPPLTISDLQRLHLHHLRHGAAGVAADLETIAGLRGVDVATLVDGIEALAAGDDEEAAAWGQVVLAFVRVALATGILVYDDPTRPSSVQS